MLVAVVQLLRNILLALVVIYVLNKHSDKSKSAQARKAKPKTRKVSYELSDEQRENIVKAILEESLLENDSAYDSLMNEGEAKYPAAAACKCDAETFNLQYGSKTWQSAWVNALAAWFDCQSEYANDGIFHLYGKEA